MKKRTVVVEINNISTDVNLIAKRGAVLYGHCVTPSHSIGLVELLEISEGSTGNRHEVRELKQITIHELMREEHLIKNKVQVTVSCFVANAHLETKFPELKAKLTAKIMELTTKIQPAILYDF